MTRLGLAGIQAGYANQADPITAAIARIRSVVAQFPWLHLVVLPELALYGPDPKHALSFEDGPLRPLQNLARELDIWLIPGSFVERECGLLYNTAPVFNPAGELVEKCRKLYPWTPYEQGITPGDRFCVFEIPGLCKVGVSICYDGWFPETTRALAWLGAEVVVRPVLTPTIDRSLECCLARANAATNQLVMLEVNAPDPMGAGQSILVNQDGDVLHCTGVGLETLPMEIDLAQLRTARTRGLKNLGQPLKSFRDSNLAYPQYQPDATSPTLVKLGPLTKPERITS